MKQPKRTMPIVRGLETFTVQQVAGAMIANKTLSAELQYMADHCAEGTKFEVMVLIPGQDPYGIYITQN